VELSPHALPAAVPTEFSCHTRTSPNPGPMGGEASGGR
jgi:hypothetical protein